MYTTRNKIALASLIALLGSHAAACLDRPIGLIEPADAGGESKVGEPPVVDGHFCVDDGDCEEGFSCWANCCEPDFLPSGSTGSAAGGQMCAQLLPNARIDPTIVVLADRSGSMDDELTSGESHWEALHEALMDRDEGVIPVMSPRAHFGVTDYTCTADAKDLDLSPLTLGDFEAIEGAYRSGATLGNYTPTGDAIDELSRQLQEIDTPGPKMILLATDGEPNICGLNDPAKGQQRAVEAAQSAYMQGIKTTVVAVGTGFSDAHLGELANAGAGVPLDGTGEAKAYRAEHKDELVDHLYEIVTAEQSCVIKLDTPMDPAAAVDAHITVGFVVLENSEIDGWTLRDANHIELHGDACFAVQHDGAVVGGELCAVD